MMNKEEKEFQTDGAKENSWQEKQPNFIMQGAQEHTEAESQADFVKQEPVELEQPTASQPNFVMQEPTGVEQQTDNQPNFVSRGEQADALSQNTSMAGTNSVNQMSNRSVQPQNNGQYNFWQQQSGGMGQQQMGGNNTAQPNFFNGNNNNYQGYTAQPVGKPEKKEHLVLKKVGKGLLAGLAAGAGFCIIVFGANKLGIVNTTTTTGTTKQASSLASTIVTSSNSVDAPNDLTSVVDKCMPSIVSINSTVTSSYQSFFGSYDQDSTGSGSGIILKISDDDILIVTNNHVIADAKKISVGFYGADAEEEMVEATVKGTDSTHDLAVVVVKKKNVPENIQKNITAAELGSSDEVKVGQMAIAIGNSLGYGQSLTVGYVSAKDRAVEVDEGTMKLLQTDAAINPGNSGGALLDSDGKVIGINSAKYADTSVEGMGFAIPITDAVPIINDLMEREVLSEEEKGYLGVSGTDITEEVQQQYPNMPLGVYISQVSKDGAAYKAGIVVGDIIVGVDDTEILTITELAEKINSYRIGTKLTLKVKRYEKGEYVEQEIKVTLKGKETLDDIGGNDSDNSSDSQNNSGNNSNGNNNGNNSNGNQNGQDNQGQTNPYGNGSQNDMQEFYNYFYGN